tara:strand:- start:103 stop:309 length:207 start_codon:yes stop_codon:yes gene_type:complete
MFTLAMILVMRELLVVPVMSTVTQGDWKCDRERTSHSCRPVPMAGAATTDLDVTTVMAHYRTPDAQSD